MKTKSIFIIFAACALTAADVHAQESLIGGGRVGNTQRVLRDETPSPQSAGAAPIDPDNKAKSGFQSSQNFVFAGHPADRGMQRTSTTEALEVACQKAEDYAKEVICKGDDETRRAFDAASKVLGIPSAVLACIAAQKEGESSGGSGGSPDEQLRKQMDEQQKKDEPFYKQQKEDYLKKKGGKESAVDGYAFTSARDCREVIAMIEQTNPHMVPDGRKGFLGLAYLCVIVKFGGSVAGLKAIQGGSLDPAKLTSEFPEETGGVKDCLNRAGAKHVMTPFE